MKSKPIPPLSGKDVERFWNHVKKTRGCWLWTGFHNDKNRYGRFKVGRRFLLAHRVSYTILVGPIPDDMTLDHTCRNELCVRPKHLEVVTMAENTRRAARSASTINARKTHCIRGHALNGDNLILTDNGKRRECRVCARVRWRRYGEKRTARTHGVAT